jgi:hypothetical protein
LVWGIVLFCYRLDIRFVVFFKNDWMDFNQWAGLIFHNFADCINILLLFRTSCLSLKFPILGFMNWLRSYLRNWWKQFLVLFLLFAWILNLWWISKFPINRFVFLMALPALGLGEPIWKWFFRSLAKI